MKAQTKSLCIRTLALAISTLPPIIATLTYFPIWKHKGPAAALSGFTLVLLLISAIPLFKHVKRFFESASSVKIWLVLFIIFIILRNIADEMTTISLVGLISNCIGALLFKIASKED